MGVTYAEVIGDPIAHSKSPLIHRFWLEKLGLEGDYRAARVRAKDLPAYLERRRRDPYWRGCNLTAPLKERAAELVGDPVGACRYIGSANCIVRSPLSCLVAANSDLAGIAAALAGIELEGASVVLIGSGGAARTALCYLMQQRAGDVALLARHEAKARNLLSLAPSGPRTRIEPAPIEKASMVIERARLIINATPMGMIGQPPMREEIMRGLASYGGQETVVFDMVYDPLETELLALARTVGARAVDGLVMLIGQAAPAFELFFGARPPRLDDPELRGLLRS